MEPVRTMDNAAEVMSIANGNGLENLYCKHDGSLDDGFEMVTHPRTLAYHQAEMPWAAILQKAVQMGYTSHQGGHLRASTFTSTATLSAKQKHSRMPSPAHSVLFSKRTGKNF